MLVPSLKAWLEMPQDEIAGIIRQAHLTVFFHNDGTRRQYLLARHLEVKQISLDSMADYALFTAKAHVAIYDLLFCLGVERVMTVIIDPTIIARGTAYQESAAKMNAKMLFEGDFAALYKAHQLKVRCFGDYDFGWASLSIRQQILETSEALKALTPEGQAYLHLGYYAESFSSEIIQRSNSLSKTLGYCPSEDELRRACFPEGLAQVNIMITAGIPRTGHLLHPLLDNGKTDTYVLSSLLLNLREEDLRLMIYDHLFLRSAHNDFSHYSSEDMEALHQHYQGQQQIFGLGKLMKPGIWLPSF